MRFVLNKGEMTGFYENDTPGVPPESEREEVNLDTVLWTHMGALESHTVGYTELPHDKPL